MREINHLSVHQWIRSAIRESQQPTSPIGFLFLKLPPPPCAVLQVPPGPHGTIIPAVILCVLRFQKISTTSSSSSSSSSYHHHHHHHHHHHLVIIIVILACPDASCESRRTKGSCRVPNIHIYIHVNIHMNIHIYIYIYIHIHTQMYVYEKHKGRERERQRDREKGDHDTILPIQFL